MRRNTESKKGTRRNIREGIPPELPDILEETARVLKDNGCSQSLVRAALLSLCGIEIKQLNMSALSIW